jgi:hypothetical protein
MLPESEVSLFRSVGGRTQSVRSQTYPSKERDQGYLVKDLGIEGIFGLAEEESL